MNSVVPGYDESLCTVYPHAFALQRDRFEMRMMTFSCFSPFFWSLKLRRTRDDWVCWKGVHCRERYHPWLARQVALVVLSQASTRNANDRYLHISVKISCTSS